MECGIRGVSKAMLLAPFFLVQFYTFSAEVIGLAARTLIREDKKILTAFFCPQEGQLVSEIIVDLIGQSKEIYGAFYQCTHQPVIDGLKAISKARQIPVHVVVDANGNMAKILSLPSSGVNLYMEGGPGLMHNKVMVFMGVLGGRNVVMTGSMNMTDSGVYRNCENILFCDDQKLVNQYRDQIQALMKKSHKLSEVEVPI